MDPSSNSINQEALNRQLIKDNLRLQAQVRMLFRVILASTTLNSWDGETADFVFSDPGDTLSGRLPRMLGLNLQQVIEKSPLVGMLDDKDIKELSKPANLAK